MLCCAGDSRAPQVVRKCGGGQNHEPRRPNAGIHLQGSPEDPDTHSSGGATTSQRRPPRNQKPNILFVLIRTDTAMSPASDRTSNTGSAAHPLQGIQATATELREIIKEGYIYGFPMVDSYRIQDSYFVDRSHPEFKGDWNQPHSTARVYTPQDKAMQTPNSDTPYTFLGADLRAEPLVIGVPAVPKGRYYSLQFIDMYTHNFAYVGSRATGNEAGHYLLAGPIWQGPAPEGVKSIIRSETDFAFVLYRTQLFGTS